MSTRLAIVQRNQSEDKRTLNEEQLPIPKLEKSQVLVKVKRAALNPTDGWCCQKSQSRYSILCQ
jgi:NADPH:quinone reductase-like Zn-dependent oxidoreductase